MESRSARLRKIRNLALLLAALSFLILLVSAYIRLSGAGLDCSPWPDCYGQLLVGGPYQHSDAARILHRVVASSALLLGFVLAWQCQRPQPIQPAARYATALLVLMILLTFVGIWSADPHRVWAAFINILGGAGLVLLSWRTALAAGTEQAPSPRRRPAALLHAGLGTLALTMALGALIGARYAAIACPYLPTCIDASWPAAAGWSALNPFTRVAVAALMGDDGGVALHLLHRYCALATLLLLGLGGLRALAQPASRQSAALLLALLLVQFALGVLTVLSGLSLRLAIAHSICAAALLAVGMQVLIRAKGAAA
ncbi:MAG: COX15/CtaA family protein [Rhodocyclales bacterium]|nr:COX15/CtaA family protein [Rhodocyclales bacterium]